MSREAHVRFYEGLVVKLPGPLTLWWAFSTEQRPNVFCKSFENGWRSSAWNYIRTGLD
jgi:hypothetical protein